MNSAAIKPRLLAALIACSASLPISSFAQASYEFRKPAQGLAVSAGPSNPGDSGSGAPPAPQAQLQLSTSALNFGNVATHTTETRQVLVSNPGTGSLSFTALPQVLGDSAFDAGATSCGTTLAAGGSCVAEAVFSPTEVGSFSGTLRLSSALAGSPHDVSLTGVAYNPVSLSAATLPQAQRNRAYTPFDFATLLGVSNEASPELAQVAWSVSGDVPAGMSFTGSTLSGTPTQLTSGAGASFTVTASYKNNQGQQVYVLQVGEAFLDAVQVAPGTFHTCAVTTSGEAKCWGRNDQGQLGDGTTTQRLVPVTVSGLSSGVAAISAGANHSCAVLTTGAMRCWGSNSNGQLGTGSFTPATSSVPFNVLNVSNAVSVSAGSFHTCIITTASAARCWGSNANGRLGTGALIGNYSGVATVSGLTSGVTSLSAANSHTCAVHNGAAKCWRGNVDGNLGDNTQTQRETPVSVIGLTSGVSSIAAGNNHSCAVHNGAAKCWGGNDSGQLGDGTTTQRRSPVTVSGHGSNVSKLVAGGSFTCALTTAGAAKCWGFAGRLGNGTNTTSTTAVDVVGLTSGVSNLWSSSSASHTCATLTSGGVRCWGMNYSGQLGDGTTTAVLSPVSVGD